jgi:hypothetical protein
MLCRFVFTVDSFWFLLGNAEIYSVEYIYKVIQKSNRLKQKKWEISRIWNESNKTAPSPNEMNNPTSRKHGVRTKTKRCREGNKETGPSPPIYDQGVCGTWSVIYAWSFWFCLEHLLHRRCSSSRVRLPIAGAPYIFPCAEGASGWALSVAAQFGTRWFPSPVRILSLS